MMSTGIMVTQESGHRKTWYHPKIYRHCSRFLNNNLGGGCRLQAHHCYLWDQILRRPTLATEILLSVVEKEKTMLGRGRG
jgi:hypothetical protein